MCITVQASAKIAITWAPRKPLLLHRYGGGFLQVARCPPSLLQPTLHVSKNKVGRKGRENHAGYILFLWVVLFLHPLVVFTILPPGCCIILYIVAPK